jgi:hypothetical protein
MIFNSRRAAAIGALCLLAAVPSATAAATAGTTRAQQRTIATTTLTQFKVVLVATRGPSSGGAPSATVTATGYKHSSAGWKVISTKTIGQPGQWFWYPVQACSLTATELATTSSGTTTPVAAIKASLLVTPSIGCSKTYTETWTP